VVSGQNCSSAPQMSYLTDKLRWTHVKYSVYGSPTAAGRIHKYLIWQEAIYRVLQHMWEGRSIPGWTIRSVTLTNSAVDHRSRQPASKYTAIFQYKQTFKDHGPNFRNFIRLFLSSSQDFQKSFVSQQDMTS